MTTSSYSQLQCLISTALKRLFMRASWCLYPLATHFIKYFTWPTRPNSFPLLSSPAISWTERVWKRQRFRRNARLRIGEGHSVEHGGSAFVSLPSLQGLRKAHVEVDTRAFFFIMASWFPLLHGGTQNIDRMAHVRSLERFPSSAMTSQLSNFDYAL